MKTFLPVVAFALGLASCHPRAVPSGAVHPVEVGELALEFPGPGRGRVEVVLAIDAEAGAGWIPTDVEWELWLDGRRFAAGAQQLILEEGRRIRLELPLAFRHFPTRGEARWVDVALRGRLSGLRRGEPVEYGFEHKGPLRARGAPLLAPGSDD